MTQGILIEVPPPKKPIVISAREVAHVTKALRAATDWMTAKALHAETGTDDRKLRAIANQSKGAIISGQKGYRLTAKASITEVAHASAWLRHPGVEMIERSVEIERFYHKRGKQ